MSPVRAAVLESLDAPFALADVELDAPRRGEVLVRVVACGLCHSDLSVQDGTTPFAVPAVLGHEGAGIVKEVGEDVASVAPGDHVVLQSSSCGQCVACLRGHPLHCDTWRERNLGDGRRMDGSATLRRDGAELGGHFFGQSSFATHALADERAVAQVPREAPLELLGPLGCGVQTGAQAVLEVLRPRAGSTLAVFGAGAVGLSGVIAASHLTGARVIAVDVHANRLQLATELGAQHVVDATATDVVETILELTGGRGVDASLESSGVPAVLRQAVDALAPRGSCAMVGVPRMDAEVSLPIVPQIAKGVTLVGINQGEVVAQDSIPALARLHLAGRFPFDRLVSFYELDELNQAADDARSGAVVKPILRMPEG